jgi:hypothetical protein
MTALRLVAILEAGTSISLAIQPGLVTQLLLGEGVSGAGTVLSRFAGFALLALGVACWPTREPGSSRTATAALFVYSLLAMLYFMYLGIVAHVAGVLLWPAVVVHAGATLLTAATLRHSR